MDRILRLAELLDHIPRIVAFLLLTPTRRGRAAEEGWPVELMRRIDWGMSGGDLAGRLVERLGATAPCGCRYWGAAVVLYDIDCVEHDAFGIEA